MSMIRMNIAADNSALAELQFLLARMGAQSGVLPATAAAMNAGAHLIQEKWRGFAMGGDLQGVERLNSPSAGYARSIKVRRLRPFQYEIYSESRIAERVENGTPDLDMKTTHPFGPRSRVSEDGVPYLIIPIRWGTPNTVGFKNIMPESVYGIVRKFKKMKTKVSADDSQVKTPTARGAHSIIAARETVYNQVGRAQYNTGFGRLNGAEFGDMEGMVRTHESTGKNRAGGYFTFRVISANSPAGSWIRRGEAARPITRALAGYSNRFIEEMVDSAIKEDLSL